MNSCKVRKISNKTTLTIELVKVKFLRGSNPHSYAIDDVTCQKQTLTAPTASNTHYVRNYPDLRFQLGVRRSQALQSHKLATTR